jgi:hypothetical protein
MRTKAVRAFPVGAIALLLLLVASPASACNCPTLMITGPMGAAAPHVAGPGDQVTYTVTELTSGATYSILVDGTEIAGGQLQSGTQVSGTFVVPDLGGSSRNVNVEAKVTHEDFNQEGCNTRPRDYLEYTIPAAPPSGTPGASAPLGDQRGAPSETTPAKERTERTRRPAGHRPEQPASTPTPIAPHPSRGAPLTHPVAVGVTGSTGTADHIAAGRANVELRAADGNAIRQGRGGSTAARAGPVAAMPFRAAAGPSHANGVARAGPDRDSLPAAALIALGLLAVAGMAGGGWAFVRARLCRPAPEPEAAARAVAPPEAAQVNLDAELSRLLSGEVDAVDVEAELQRMIAVELPAPDVPDPAKPVVHR